MVGEKSDSSTEGNVSTRRYRRWQFVPGYDDRYLVSTDGLVARLLKPRMKGLHGRISAIGRDGRRHDAYIHRWVLETFVGPCPVGMEACHRNDDAMDNRLDNLRWDTRQKNRIDAQRNRSRRLKEAVFPRSKGGPVSRVEKLRIAAMLERGMSHRDVAFVLKRSRTVVEKVASGPLDRKGG